jgi:AcrR family transcriptional regulator
MTPARARARRGDGALLRSEIVAAAAQLLAATGDEDSVSIRAIAKAVGVTPPSIYLHFADKTALMYAVCEDRFTALDELMEQAAASATDALDAIRRRGEAYIRFGLDNPEHYRILFMDRSAPAEYDESSLRTTSAFGHLVGAVEEAMASGALAPADPFVVAVGLWATVHGITSLMIAKRQFPWPPLDVISNHLLCTRLDAIAASPAERGT